MRPLPAMQRVTNALVVRSTRGTSVRMGRIRTCSGTGQIGGLLGRTTLTIGFAMARWRQRLAVCAIHGGRLTDTTPDSMGGDESLRLSRDGREDAVLVEAHAVGAAAVFSGLEARASNLRG